MITIIIPAYNEELRIHTAITDVTQAFASSVIPGDGAYELIVVDDGSTDRTVSMVRTIKDAPIKILTGEPNRGKGYAVRRGLDAAKGKLALIIDADGSAPIRELRKLLAAIDAGADIAIGSRGLHASTIPIPQGKMRQTSGKIFNGMLRFLGLTPFQDTQCGFKLIQMERFRPVLSSLTMNGFAFDVELLYRAKKAGLKISEVPITWSNDAATRVTFWRGPVRMAWDILWFRLKTLLS